MSQADTIFSRILLRDKTKLEQLASIFGYSSRLIGFILLRCWLRGKAARKATWSFADVSLRSERKTSIQKMSQQYTWWEFKYGPSLGSGKHGSVTEEKRVRRSTAVKVRLSRIISLI